MSVATEHRRSSCCRAISAGLPSRPRPRAALVVAGSAPGAARVPARADRGAGSAEPVRWPPSRCAARALPDASGSPGAACSALGAIGSWLLPC